MCRYSGARVVPCRMPRPPAYKTPGSPLPKILDAVRGGADLATACRIGGIGVDTLLRWMGNDESVRNQVEGAQNWARSALLVVHDRTPGPAHHGGCRDQGEPDGADAREGRAARSEAGSAKHPESHPNRSDHGRRVTPAGGRWERVREEAAALGPGLFGCLLWLEGRIGDHNRSAPAWDQLPAMPAPLVGIFRDFWASGKQELLIRAGRGFGKSTMFCRPTLVECLFGPRVVNGGEIAIWPELSVDMDEANLKVSVLERLLKLAGFRVGEPEDEGSFATRKQERGRTRIQFQNAEHERIEIRVYPATVNALSGPTLKGGRHDEEAKWKASSKDGTNSAEDVLDAEAGAFRGRPQAHLYRVSSAWRTEGPHFVDVEAGDTPSRHVAKIGGEFLPLALAGFEARARVSTPADAAEIRAYAATLTADSPNLPSWFNPSLDPAALKARSVRVFLREYGSRSTGASDDGDFFDAILLDAAEVRARPRGAPDAVFAAIDTGAKRNPAALAIVGKWESEEGTMFAPLVLRAWKPKPGAPLDLRLVVLPAMAGTLGAPTGSRPTRWTSWRGAPGSP